MKKTIYLIRHGQTTMNAKGKMFSGSSDVSLSEEGIRATKEVAGNPLLKSVKELYVTPLIRTHQTADLLFGPDFPRTVIPELAEMDFGDYEGVLITPEKESSDPIIHKWSTDPEHLTFPGGENMREHTDKAYEALLRLIRSSESDVIAIVAHATTIRLLLTMVFGTDMIVFRKLPCDNVHVTALSWDGESLKVQFMNLPLISDASKG